MSPTVTRPMSIPEIADRAVTVMVRPGVVVAILVLIAAALGGLPDLFFDDQTQFYQSFATVMFISAVVAVAIGPGLTRLYADEDAPRDLARLWRYSASVAGRALSTTILFGLFSTLPLLLIAVPIGLEPRIGYLGAAVATIPALALAPPAFYVVALGYPTALLEETGAFATFGAVWRRATWVGYRRAWLLGAIFVAIEVAPPLVLEHASAPLRDLLHLEHLSAASGAISDALGDGIGLAFSTVAAIELRLRVEGDDLLALLGAQTASSASPTASSPGASTSQ